MRGFVKSSGSAVSLSGYPEGQSSLASGQCHMLESMVSHGCFHQGMGARHWGGALRRLWGGGLDLSLGWREGAAETSQGNFISSILTSSRSKNARLGGTGHSSEPGLVEGWVCNLGRCCTRGDVCSPEITPLRGEGQEEGGLSSSGHCCAQ